MTDRRSMSQYWDPQLCANRVPEETDIFRSAVTEQRCSCCPCYVKNTSLLQLSGSSDSLSVHLLLLLLPPQSPSTSAAPPARPQRSERAFLSATAGSNHGNHQSGPGSCFWICTGIVGREERWRGEQEERNKTSISLWDTQYSAILSYFALKITGDSSCSLVVIRIITSSSTQILRCVPTGYLSPGDTPVRTLTWL